MATDETEQRLSGMPLKQIGHQRTIARQMGAAMHAIRQFVARPHECCAFVYDSNFLFTTLITKNNMFTGNKVCDKFSWRREPGVKRQSPRHASQIILVIAARGNRVCDNTAAAFVQLKAAVGRVNALAREFRLNQSVNSAGRGPQCEASIPDA